MTNKSLLGSLKAIYYINKNISVDASLSNGLNPNTDDIGKLFKNDNDVIVPNNMLSEKSINLRLL